MPNLEELIIWFGNSNLFDPSVIGTYGLLQSFALDLFAKVPLQMIPVLKAEGMAIGVAVGTGYSFLMNYAVNIMEKHSMRKAYQSMFSGLAALIVFTPLNVALMRMNGISWDITSHSALYSILGNITLGAMTPVLLNNVSPYIKKEILPKMASAIETIRYNIGNKHPYT